MTKQELYTACLREIDIRLEKGGDLTADLGNVAAVLNKRLDFYWIGFYLLKQGRLVLGPFQGTPACVFLECGKGVCGTAAEQKTAIVVPDVEKFEGHVACDPKSKSEIAIPCFDTDNQLRAVLDVDSNHINHFDEIDRINLEEVANRIRNIWKKLKNETI